MLLAVLGAVIFLGYKMKDSVSKLIERFEGFSATAYNDPQGSDKYSIGFGHQIKAGENFGTITRAEGIILLAQDTADAQDAVDQYVTAPLNMEQRAALVSFVYNVGVGAFSRGSVPEKLNAGDFHGAAATMRRYIHAGGAINAGLVARREIEAATFDV